MLRLACVELGEFPLRILLRDHPSWTREPVVVVDRDDPHGVVEYANESARRSGILPGQTYAFAFSLDSRTRAGTVSPHELDRRVAGFHKLLHRFSMDIEPSREEPGIFWMKASPTFAPGDVRAALEAEGFPSSIAVGFTRFGVYAAARIGTGAPRSGVPGRGTMSRRTGGAANIRVFRTPEEEHAFALETPLARFPVDSEMLDALARLGVCTLADFVRLPAQGLRERFGPEAARLHRIFTGDLSPPLDPRPEEIPLRRALAFENPEENRERLLFLYKRLIDALLAGLAAAHQALVAMTLHGTLDNRSAFSELLRPATPTLESRILMDLVRLRLESLSFPSPVVEIGVTVTGGAASCEQLRIFHEEFSRDPAGAGAALARIRAEWGEDAVVRAELRDGHLPEARFAWTPLAHPVLPRPKEARAPTLVRRIRTLPRPTPRAAFRRLDGPYVVSGGWWAHARGRETRRDYYFAEDAAESVWWVFHDRERKTWFVQGRVE
jgi:protein ImuB